MAHPRKHVTLMLDHGLVERLRTLAALRRARAVAAVTELQRRSAELCLSSMPAEEIDAEIRAARRSAPPRPSA